MYCGKKWIKLLLVLIMVFPLSYYVSKKFEVTKNKILLSIDAVWLRMRLYFVLYILLTVNPKPTKTRVVSWWSLVNVQFNHFFFLRKYNLIIWLWSTAASLNIISSYTKTIMSCTYIYVISGDICEIGKVKNPS